MASQLTVFIENRPGALSEITGVLAEAGINIQSIMVEGEHDFGFARIQAHPFREADRVLREEGFQVQSGEVLRVSLANQPGELHGVLEALAEAEVNVEMMFGTAAEGPEESDLVLQVDDTEKARQILELD